MATEYIDHGLDDGAIYGRSDGKIAFYGATPQAQRANIADVTTTDQAVAAINSLLATFRLNGLTAAA